MHTMKKIKQSNMRVTQGWKTTFLCMYRGTFPMGETFKLTFFSMSQKELAM